MKLGLMCLLAFAPSVVAASQATEAKPPFTVTISSPQSDVRIGTPIVIHIVLKSTSEKQITVPEAIHAGNQGEYNYRIFVHGPGGNVPSDTPHGARMKKGGEVETMSRVLIYPLNLGDEITDDVDLNNVVAITTPGDYVVEVERADRLYSDQHIRSNKLVLHVAP